MNLIEKQLLQNQLMIIQQNMFILSVMAENTIIATGLLQGLDAESKKLTEATTALIKEIAS
jgi:hypothetical protein